MASVVRLNMLFSIYYLLDSRFPSEKAYSIQIMRTCDALAKRGHKVTLIVPKISFQTEKMKGVKNPFRYYGVLPKFKIYQVPALNLFGTRFHDKIIAQFILTISFMLTTFILILRHIISGKKINVLFLRSLTPSFAFAPLLKKIFNLLLVFEAHDFPSSKSKPIVRAVLQKYDGVITITKALRALYRKQFSPSYKIVSIPDAVDLSIFETSETKEGLRKKLNLPLDANIVVYTGHLYNWKGVNILVSAMEKVEKIKTNVFLWIVGGYESDIKRIKDYMIAKKIRNVKFVGYVSPSLVPLYLKASDIAVLPNPANTKSMYYSSPLKLFEYMAAKIPIIASDLHAVKEILNHKVNAYLVRPESPEELSKAILYLIDNKEIAAKLSEIAFSIVEKEYTWEARGRKIEDYIKQCYENARY